MILSLYANRAYEWILSLCFMNVINVTWKKGGAGSCAEALLHQLILPNENLPRLTNENARFAQIDQ